MHEPLLSCPLLPPQICSRIFSYPKGNQPVMLKRLSVTQCEVRGCTCSLFLFLKGVTLFYRPSKVSCAALTSSLKKFGSTCLCL